MEIEKTVKFIQSVQSRLEASVEKHDEQLAKIESPVSTLTSLVGRLADSQVHLAERMAAGFQQVEAGFRQLREIQASTENKLNALIDTVDKIVRRDGHKE
jgi:chromosome segregation ATPase